MSYINLIILDGEIRINVYADEHTDVCDHRIVLPILAVDESKGWDTIVFEASNLEDTPENREKSLDCANKIRAWLERNEKELEQLIVDMDTALNDGLKTQSAKKDILSTVSKILDREALQPLRSLALNSGRDDLEVKEIYNLLPYSIYLHQFNGLKKKLEKLAKKNKVAKQYLETFNNWSWLAENGLAVKDVVIEPKETKAESAAKARVAAWKLLPAPSAKVVKEILSSVSEKLEERKLHRVEKVVEIGLRYSEDVAEIDKRHNGQYTRDCRKEKMELRERYAEMVGMTVLSILQSSRDYIEKVMEDQKQAELLKVEDCCLTWVRNVHVTKVENIHIDVGADLVDGKWKLFETETSYRIFEFRGIFAGGYNIQRLHIRTIGGVSNLITE